MGFFKHEQGGQDLKSKLTTECTGPIEKMESAINQRGGDVSAFTEAKALIDVVLKVHDQGPAALPQEVLQTQEAKQQTPSAKEQLQAVKQQSQEITTQENEHGEESRFGMGSGR
ncbi:hypothetical protein [Legionella bozemanae]|uniref:Fir n=1 Tax=Legionella bozemanae TaxID=447 RepID=D6BJN6_LEGBO|nr:hypothetical protein [Legionella bozemanae]ACF77009.1 Fir [Legionella bozemanae]KTC75032.1 hypothetical protein Lboz_1019 [Legionella bozemanae]STO35051.1 Uncharacterised protein [Legionella bozemanae]